MLVSTTVFLTLFVLTHTQSFTVTQVTNPVTHAECPSWDPRTNLLYFVDIPNGAIYSYDYDSKKNFSISLQGNVAPVVQSKNPNQFIVGLDTKIVSVGWDGKSSLGRIDSTTLTTLESPTGVRLNDGKADSTGRIWFGTMDEQATNNGALYKIGKDHKAETMVQPVNTSNGQAWNKANTRFYYIDTPTRKISSYDYDAVNGTISNKSTAFDVAAHNITGSPDGMTIDKDDNLWIALWDGAAVINVNPETGELLLKVPLPVNLVTSTMWGGPNLDILFVTTSSWSNQPGAGAVYTVTGLNTTGLPVFEADIV